MSAIKQVMKKAVQLFGLEIKRYIPRPHPLSWLKNNGYVTIIDAGANVGQFATEVRELLPEATIYSFEPLRECYETLVNKFATDAHFKAFNCALGEAQENTAIHRSEYTPSSSLLPMAKAHEELFPHSKNTYNEDICIERLDQILSSEPLASKILLKLDVQGFEDKVIKGAGDLIARIDAILIETSFIELYSGQPLFSDIYTLLSGLGFVYKGSYQEKRDKKYGKVISEDSIFTRE